MTRKLVSKPRPSEEDESLPLSVPLPFAPKEAVRSVSARR